MVHVKDLKSLLSDEEQQQLGGKEVFSNDNPVSPTPSQRLFQSYLQGGRKALDSEHEKVLHAPAEASYREKWGIAQSAEQQTLEPSPSD
jgi:hypothetical protein